MKLIAALALAIATAAGAQTINPAEAARRDTDPVLNGHVRDVQDATQAAAIAARKDSDPRLNGTPSDTKPASKAKTVAKR